MIIPSDIKPLSLPSVQLSERRDLPELPAIYFVIDTDDTIQYIGRAVNCRNRWNGQSHHRYAQLAKMSNVRIAYLTVDDKSLLDIVEEALIEWFEPSLNFRRTPKSGYHTQCKLSRKRKPVGFRLDEEVINALKIMARKENTSVNRFIETYFFQLAKEKGLISPDKDLLGETRGGDTTKDEEV